MKSFSQAKCISTESIHCYGGAMAHRKESICFQAGKIWFESWLHHCRLPAWGAIMWGISCIVLILTIASKLMTLAYWSEPLGHQIPHLKSNSIQYLATPNPERACLASSLYQMMIQVPSPMSLCLPLSTLHSQWRRCFLLPKYF